MRDRVLSDVRLLVEHLLLQPRDQHRFSSVAFAHKDPKCRLRKVMASVMKSTEFHSHCQ